jgi:hypothetical protein
MSIASMDKNMARETSDSQAGERIPTKNVVMNIEAEITRKYQKPTSFGNNVDEGR